MFAYFQYRHDVASTWRELDHELNAVLDAFSRLHPSAAIPRSIAIVEQIPNKLVRLGAAQAKAHHEEFLRVFPNGLSPANTIDSTLATLRQFESVEDSVHGESYRKAKESARRLAKKEAFPGDFRPTSKGPDKLLESEVPQWNDPVLNRPTGEDPSDN